MDKEQLERLKELAEKATPGPWATGQNVERVLGRRHDMNQGTVYMNYKDCGPCPRVEVFYNPHEGSMQTEQDAAYIAAANPTVVLALIDRIEELEKADNPQALTALALVYSDKEKDLEKRIKELEKEADWLAGALESFVSPIESAVSWREQARKAVVEVRQ